MFNFLAQGFLGFIFWLNNFFQDFGLTIIFFTLILKIVLLPIEFLAFLEEEKMKRLRPKINEVLKKYKNDFQKQAEVLTQLYKEENYNPLFTMLDSIFTFANFLWHLFCFKSFIKNSKS
jgi:YidC/Oxa1 family membrane protein insertase